MEKLEKEADVVFAGLLFSGACFCKYKINSLKEERAQNGQKTAKKQNEIRDSIIHYRQVALGLSGFALFIVSRMAYKEVQSGYRYQPITKKVSL